MDVLRHLFLLVLTFTAVVARKQKGGAPSYGAWKDNWDATAKAYIIPVVLSATNPPINSIGTLLGLTEELKATACIELKLLNEADAPTEGDYLEVREIFSASMPCVPSAFGKEKAGKNEVVFASSCPKYLYKMIILAHLGMRFTHQRTDRDQYVVISPPNSNSPLVDVSQPPAHDLTPYDFKSIMSVAYVRGFHIYKFDAASTSVERFPNNLVLSPGDGVILLELYYNSQCPIANPCSTSNPCENGGKCFDQKQGNPYCSCTAFYEGENCTDRIIQCKNDTCKNGGVCIEGSGNEGYRCDCVATLGGDHCELELLQSGWFPGGNGYQYRLTSNPGHWYSANRECKKLNAELAHDGIRDPETFSFLNQIFTGPAIWIGAAAQYVSSYYWNDNIGFSGTWEPWGYHEPTPGDTNHCAAIADLSTHHGTERSLANLDCNTEIHGLCEKFIGNPLTFGVYRPGNGKMYFKTPAPTNYRIAMEQCQERGAHLIVFGADTSAQLKNIVDNVFGSSEYYIYVGYEDFGSRRTFKSVIGNKILSNGDDRWADGEPSQRKDHHNAVVTSVELNGKLRDVYDKRLRAYGLCEAPDQPAQSECNCSNGKCALDYVLGIEICICSPGYVKDSSGNCIDDNECTDGTNSCDLGDECVNLPGSYVCVPVILF